MLQNYMITALRNILRHKLYSAINIGGLAVGLAACILMMLYVQHEVSYDTHWGKSDRLVQLNSRFSYSADRVDDFTGAAGGFKQALPAYFPEEIERATRFYRVFPNLFFDGKVTDQQVMWTDRETLDMFDFDVIKGDMAQVFADNRSLALSETVAKKLFGSSDLVGRVITVELGSRREDFKIEAVYRDLPKNSVMDMPAVALYDQAGSFPGFSDNWWNIQAATYFELKDGVALSLFDGRFDAFVDAQVPAGFFSEVEKSSDLLSLSAVALEDVRLYGLGGTAETVALTFAIAVLVLVIASINFINLSTAKGSQRAREVALRKSLGASRANLMAQFLGESILMAFSALIIGLFFVEMTLPAFGNFVLKDLVLDYGDVTLILMSAGLMLLVGVVGGLYPAYLLSSYRPVETLKANKTTEADGPRRVRSALVVIQFTISIVLIVAAALIYIQRDYAVNLDPGFNQKNLLTIQYLFRGDTNTNRDVLKEQALKLPSVTSATFSKNSPPFGAGNPTTFELPGKESSVSLPWQSQDSDYFDVYEIPLVAGRTFLPGYAKNIDEKIASLPKGAGIEVDLLLNESAVLLLGFGSAEEALGQTLKTNDFGRPFVFSVIGVVGDTRFNSSREKSPPQFYTHAQTESRLTLRTSAEAGQVISEVEAMWKDLYPEVPLYYYFVDDAMQEAFSDEARASVLLSLFSGLAILIACLGLYGLAAFSTERRTKEIGVRKVMGARISDIIYLFLWQFARPVLLANLIAWPVATWIMLNWLESFPYRLDAWILLPLCFGAGLGALLVAWVTVGSNVMKVAHENPINALRYE